MFAWFPGDGSDVMEGGPGNDTLQVSGANIAENISFTANGSRLRFTRDIATIVLDANAVERVTFTAQGGSDTILFGDLTGTAAKQIGVDLSALGVPDGQPDTLLINSVTGDHPITTALGPGTMTITWSPVTISVTGVEPQNDRLILQTPAGALPMTTTIPGQPTTPATQTDLAAARQ